jgi:hypothetical protein
VARERLPPFRLYRSGGLPPPSGGAVSLRQSSLRMSIDDLEPAGHPRRDFLGRVKPRRMGLCRIVVIPYSWADEASDPRVPSLRVRVGVPGAFGQGTAPTMGFMPKPVYRGRVSSSTLRRVGAASNRMRHPATCGYISSRLRGRGTGAWRPVTLLSFSMKLLSKTAGDTEQLGRGAFDPQHGEPCGRCTGLGRKLPARCSAWLANQSAMRRRGTHSRAGSEPHLERSLVGLLGPPPEPPPAT